MGWVDLCLILGNARFLSLLNVTGAGQNAGVNDGAPKTSIQERSASGNGAALQDGVVSGQASGNVGPFQIRFGATGLWAGIILTALGICSTMWWESAISGKEVLAMILNLVLGGLLGYTLATQDVLPRYEKELDRLHHEMNRISREKTDLHERFLGKVTSSTDRPFKIEGKTKIEEKTHEHG